MGLHCLSKLLSVRNFRIFTICTIILSYFKDEVLHYKWENMYTIIQTSEIEKSVPALFAITKSIFCNQNK